MVTKNRKIARLTPPISGEPPKLALEFSGIDSVLEYLDSIYEYHRYVVTIFLFEAGIFININLLQ